MKINFKKLRYRNFLAVGNEWMEIDLDRFPMTLITGSNGSGKTTIAEALIYVLFGKPHRKLNIGQLINVFNKGGLEVEVTFERGGVLYKILRGEKPKKFEIYKDGELIESKATVREYQKVLEQIVGMDRKLFTQLCVIEKNDFTPFMTLTAADRRKVVEDILNISIYSVMNKLASERLKSLKQELDNFDLDIRLKQKDIDNIQSLIEQMNQSNEQQIKEFEDKKQVLVDSCDEIKSSISAEADKAKEILNEYQQFDVDKMKDKEKKFISFESEFKTKINAEQKKIKFFEDNPVCPTCSQDMQPDHVENVVNEASKQIEDIQSKMDELIKRKSTNEQQLKEAKEIESRLHEVKQKGLSLEQDYNIKKRQISDIEKDIEKLKVKSDIEPKQQELKELEQGMETLVNNRADVNKHYDALRDIQLALKDDGAKAHVISQYMPVINTQLNEFLEAMNFSIAFQMNEKFEESFANPARADFVYHNLSNGQKSRVDFAILLSWLKIAEMKSTVSTNLLFIDEMLESFDPEGIEMLMHLFRDKFKDKNIFVISQRQDELASHFRSEIKFKLENGYTVMES